MKKTSLIRFFFRKTPTFRRKKHFNFLSSDAWCSRHQFSATWQSTKWMQAFEACVLKYDSQKQPREHLWINNTKMLLQYGRASKMYRMWWIGSVGADTNVRERTFSPTSDILLWINQGPSSQAFAAVVRAEIKPISLTRI